MMVRSTDVERQQGVRDGGAGAAGAELHHALARRVHQLALEALGEARPIGVVPDRAPVLEHHGVDGAERLRIGGKLVEQRDHRLLAGVGDVETGETEASRGCQQIGKGLDSEPERRDVDELVDVWQALLGAFALMQARRARRLDARADETAEEGTCLGPGTLGCFAARNRPRLSIRPLRGSRSVHGPNASCKGADPVSP